jgi:hypothetical protein
LPPVKKALTLRRTKKRDVDVPDRRICSECVGDSFLQSEIETRGRVRVCFYCDKKGKSISIAQMADKVEIAFEEHFYITATEPSDFEYAMSKEGDFDWERRGESVVDVICEHAAIEPEPAEDIRKVLEERHSDRQRDEMGDEGPFDEETQYAEAGVSDAESQAGWFQFERSITSQARYFSRTAEETLSSIFKGVEEHKTQEGRPIIVEAGPGKELSALYRARVFQSATKLEDALKRPDTEIGPPPVLAASPGRMNAKGIAVFYGATAPVVALAEVRPPVGSKVVVGRFELIRPVRLLDLEALRSVEVRGSIFDRELIRRLERAKFLKWLSHRISMPVMPDDEPFDYLPTQAIADFLATNVRLDLDGLLYPSVQGSESKLNVVLFHKAARVQSLDLPKGMGIWASLGHDTEDGPDVDYRVFEEVPPEATPGRSETDDFSFLSEPLNRSEDLDERKPTLKLDISSLRVYHINGIDFQTQSYSVSRHRSQKRDAKL